mmetsp:Transcript_23188/g.67621  ORF Transcript_23188/g.67621 Transcript_23188/m.67621 type:complete len:201 (+) Transcript_23188:942-1544(+)
MYSSSTSVSWSSWRTTFSLDSLAPSWATTSGRENSNSSATNAPCPSGHTSSPLPTILRTLDTEWTVTRSGPRHQSRSLASGPGTTRVGTQMFIPVMIRDRSTPGTMTGVPSATGQTWVISKRQESRSSRQDGMSNQVPYGPLEERPHSLNDPDLSPLRMWRGRSLRRTVARRVSTVCPYSTHARGSADRPIMGKVITRAG